MLSSDAALTAHKTLKTLVHKKHNGAGGKYGEQFNSQTD